MPVVRPQWDLGDTGDMGANDHRGSDSAELSSLTSSIETLSGRLQPLIDRHQSDDDADILAALHGAERALRSAARDLRRATKLTA